ncbi:sulfurtransferase-like selenium metabolism protein YedF [Anaerococcus sp. NML200537]|uniref:sulfurtransferase-like selenium metabolism protein YedF n=1 Tax=Anaerococcus sp. NML200537 TaxID=2954485 RepID=UPI0022388C79|nr:sulfurtransferase-like selenium metabolism protein YedF [Anaerococcus sp. NML200537]MCW6700851.1 sulfurtransferase-like selenium metabolism protein YedF [Anaerococcus sp. NML200537]
MKKIDCLGKVCPIPVIETKKLIKENPDETDFEILVDNEVATQNLAKMAKELKIESACEKIKDGVYRVSLKKNPEEFCEIMEDAPIMNTSSYVVAISDDRMGNGDEDFSKSLLEGFIYALTEQDVLPEKVIFYNRGVFLTSDNEKTIEDLKNLASKGVEILSCGLCLGNYKLKEKLAVGEITNMYKIVEILRSHHVVSPC